MLEKWLIAVDLDGTLFHTDHEISVRTLCTMRKVAELGHRTVVVTGRSSHSSVPRLRSMPAGTRVVCSNGAYEYDQTKQEIVWANLLSASSSLEIQQRIHRHLPTASFGWESTNGLSYEQSFIEEAGGSHTLESGGLKESLGQSDLYKLFVRTPEQKSAELAKLLQEFFEGEIEVSSSGVPFVEITAAGTNKGAALEKIASDLGIESERTIAFGDNLNDVSMFEWAGVAVAMGNAIAELKAIASAYTKSNDEDGVAQFLENKFLENY